MRCGRGLNLSGDGSYKSLNSLMRHMRGVAGIRSRGANDKKVLARIGYFHGYKGFRYSGHPSKRLPYTDFAQLRAVVEFDTGLKSLFYPIIMRLEMTMKNLAMVQILEAAGSSSLPTIYARLMPGTKKKCKTGKLEVIHANNGTLLKAYGRASPIVRHYYDSPHENVPLWGLMEVITLGHFATFLEQLDDRVLTEISHSWGISRNYGNLVPHLVFALTDLRNSVAHNGTVFDTRFSTGRIRRQVPEFLAREIGYQGSARLKFDTITDYLMLIAYLANGLQVQKRDIAGMIRQYTSLTDELHNNVPVAIFDMIVHTDNRTKLRQLEQWVRAQ